jgi:hypothetical protein
MIDQNGSVGEAFTDVAQLESDEVLSCGTFEELFGSSTAMNVIAGSSIAMNIITKSKIVMNVIASNPVSVASIWMSTTALNIVKGNSAVYSTFIDTSNTSAIIGKAVAIMVGLNPDSYADMSAIASNSTAMTTVASKSAAMVAVADSSVARQKIEDSSLARTALSNSSLKQNLDNVGCMTSYTQRRAGRVWIISQMQSNSQSETIFHQLRYTLEGNSEFTSTAKQDYNVRFAVNKFFDSITNCCYNIASLPNSYYVFIPC